MRSPMQTSRVIEALDWGASHLLSEGVSKRGAGMPSNDFRWMVHRPNLAASAATWDTRRLAGLVCARRVAEAPFDAQSGGGGCEGAQARFSGKREGVPGLSERSSEFRYVGIPVIWR